jgi:hypothetical protein
MLKVSDNRRFLTTAEGTPFFYLGDTAWELFHRLTLEEAREYLQTRAGQGFNVIHAVALAEFDGLTEPNRNGDLPLHGLDPARPNEAYFQHVDTVLELAASLGLIVGLLPTWGDKVAKKWGAGPEVFTSENARTYGVWLGRRYRDFDPLIWVNGGDRTPETAEHFATFRALAEGLQEGDAGRHLLTFHPQGGRSSAQDFHADDWLAFNLIQSGHHARGVDNAAMIEADTARRPVKPTLDSEFNYENHAINWKPDTGRFKDYDVRQSAYRSVFAGGCGVVYGCQDVWQFLDTSRHPPVAYADTPWHDALQFPGAWQMRSLKALIEARPFTTGVPAQERLIGEAGRIRVTTGEGYLLAYLPTGGTITLRLDGLGFARANVSWCDPRTGITIPAGESEAAGARTFDAPSSGLYNDWVLALDARP